MGLGAANRRVSFRGGTHVGLAAGAALAEPRVSPRRVGAVPATRSPRLVGENKGGTARWARKPLAPFGRGVLVFGPPARRTDRDHVLSDSGSGQGAGGGGQPAPRLPRGDGRPGDARVRLPEGGPRRPPLPPRERGRGAATGPLQLHRHPALSRGAPGALRPARRRL